jgi:hypothetical protein
MLCSPLTNINNLINFDISGLNLLNLPKMSAFISFFNPLKWYPASPVQDARYNFRHMDSDFFVNQTSFYAQTKGYYQPWQTSDIICLQILTRSIGPANIKIYTYNNILVESYNMDSINNQAINNYNANLPSGNVSYQLFQIQINLSAFNPNVYYATLNVGIGNAIDSFICEGFQIASSWPKTLLLEYSHSSNRNSTFFQNSSSYNFKPSIRFEGWLSKFTTKSHTTGFEDQPADFKILNSINYRGFNLNVGRKDGMPPYMFDLIAKAMGLDTTLIDGLGYTKMEEGSEWEINQPQGWPKSYRTLEIRESQNVDGIQVTTSGSEEDEILTSIFVDLQGFGEINESSNIVPILKIDT